MAAILEVKNIEKIYPDGVIANKDVSVSVEEGTIHAIVGENGAGKSTLMKVIFGITRPQNGTISFQGQEVNFKSPDDAIQQGIGMVHQHLMLASDLTVAENLVLGIEPKRRGIFLDDHEMIRLTREVAQRFSLEVPPDKKIKDLPIGIRQRVEILKALYRKAELLILDEPTAVLTPQETEVLFRTLKQLKANGKTILFISHKLREVKEIADRVTVMRDSQVITTEDAAKLSEEDISHLMVGRDIRTERIPQSETTGEVVLETKGLSFVNEDEIFVLKDVSFSVRAGEILGLAGVEGNGQTELVKLLTGLLQPTDGEIFVRSKAISGLSPRKVREIGLAHIPEDRMENGVADQASVKENLIVDRYYKAPYSRRSRLLWKTITDHTLDLVKRFHILTRNVDTPVNSLSGGNIQKVVVARELSADPDVLIASQPTRGVDVGSEEHIHSLLRQVRDEGKAVFMVSADLDEVLKLSSRILVIYNGEIVAHIPDPSMVSAEDLGPYMLGVKRQEDLGAEIHS
ncbi:MAG: ABC transporter ATP-binding protein [Spirochaetales bacterium]|nr:ABC transporter ATP-binding protein [Spirochaetales bacterium]MCF7937684.1 ABC transporter ATP-binding protein [Spirochaetales bacterium]